MKRTTIAVLVLLFAATFAYVAFASGATPVKKFAGNCPSKLWVSIAIEVHGIWATITGSSGFDNPSGGCEHKTSWLWAHFQNPDGSWYKAKDGESFPQMGDSVSVRHADYTSAKGKMKAKDELRREHQPMQTHEAETQWVQQDV